MRAPRVQHEFHHVGDHNLCRNPLVCSRGNFDSPLLPRQEELDQVLSSGERQPQPACGGSACSTTACEFHAVTSSTCNRVGARLDPNAKPEPDPAPTTGIPEPATPAEAATAQP